MNWKNLLFSVPLLFAASSTLAQETTSSKSGISGILGNVAQEGVSSLGPITIIAAFIGGILVITSMVMFATHRQGKPLTAPILFFLFGGALLSVGLLVDASKESISQGQTKTLESLVE